MGVDEVRVDPLPPGVAELVDVEFAGRNHQLAHGAIDLVPVDVDVLIDVGAKRLHLADGIAKRLPVPEPDVLEQVVVGGVIDFRFGLRVELDFACPMVQSIGGQRGGNVVFDVRLLERDFVGFHVDHRNDAG